jgi:hypothetical protein
MCGGGLGGWGKGCVRKRKRERERFVRVLAAATIEWSVNHDEVQSIHSPQRQRTPCE